METTEPKQRKKYGQLAEGDDGEWNPIGETSHHKIQQHFKNRRFQVENFTEILGKDETYEMFVW